MTNRRQQPRQLNDDRVLRFGAKEREYVFAVAMKYLKDEEEAADVAQEALLNAYRHRDSFRGDSRFSTWLYRVAATSALMALRKKRRSPVLVSAEAEDGTPIYDTRTAPGPSPEETAAAHEELHQAEDHLASMGDKYGRVFRMRFVEGYDEREIAQHLGLGLATVKTRAYRARAHVREAMQAAA
jgi:RNA polymerase sigma-70 factor (ECF subfamily)